MTPIVPDTLEFDLMLGAVPSAPYPLLPTIAQRARALLTARTPVQVESAFYTLDWLLETAYHQPAPESEQAQELPPQPPAMTGIWGQEPAKVGQATPTSPLRDRFIRTSVATLHDDLVFPPANPFSKLDTLIDYCDIWEELIADDLPQPQPAEVLAVLALMLVQEALTWLHRLRLSRSHTPTPLSLPIATAMALSGSAAIEAMAAVNRAEFQSFSEDTRERFDQLVIEHQEAERARRTQHAALMNKERHRKDREAKEKAIALWERNPSRWRGVPRAANDIADILEAQGYKYELSTVQGWLYAYGKQTSIKLR